MSVEQLITTHLDIWTAADTEKKSGRGRSSGSAGSVYGIKKLRELILELAVRGKLVPQDEKDEPASELLKRIVAEKAKLVAEGKIKKDKPLAPISDDEKPFELPKNWECVRLQEVFDVRDGTHDTPKYCDSGFPLVTSKNLYSGILDFSNIKYISEEDHFKIKERSGVDRGDILFAMIGSIGNPVIVETDNDFSIKNVALFKPYSHQLCEMYYLLKYLIKASIDMREQASGAVQSFVSLGAIRNYIFYMPPLAEQHRIVAKVDELMALCDQLENQHNNAAEAHDKLVTHLLGTLTQSQNAEDFNTQWQRISEHFDTLFTNEASIDALKQTLLQLAVMGKLVPQDPNDEPASDLLKRIQAEKAKLIAEGKIKSKSSCIDFDGLEELKKMIPSSWAWIRLGEISDIVRGGSPRPAGDLRFYDGKIPFLKVGDLTRSQGKMVDGFTSTIKEAGLTKTRLINTRTVLLTNSGATLGVPAICDFEATFNDGIAAFIFLTSEVFDEYLYLYLKSISTWFLEVAAQGQGQPNLNTDIIRSTWVPITSIEEQRSIVKKVDELMVICDQLKSRLTAANQLQQKIADVMTQVADC